MPSEGSAVIEHRFLERANGFWLNPTKKQERNLKFALNLNPNPLCKPKNHQLFRSVLKPWLAAFK